MMVDRHVSMKRIAVASLLLTIAVIPTMLWLVSRTGAVVTGNDLAACRSLAASDRTDASTEIQLQLVYGLKGVAERNPAELAAAVDAAIAEAKVYEAASDAQCEAIVRSIADSDRFIEECRVEAERRFKNASDGG